MDNNFDNFFEMLQLTSYKKATLYIPEKENATWFIFWYNFNPASGKLERVRKTFNLNRIADIAARTAKATELCAIIDNALAKGANIFTAGTVKNDRTAAQKASEPKSRENLSIAAAFARALIKHTAGLKKRSAGTYRSAVKVFTDWITETGMDHIGIDGITPSLLDDYIVQRKTDGLSNVTINNQMGYLLTIFKKMKKMGIIEANPLNEYEALPEIETDYYEPFTQQELSTIGNYLRSVNPDFALFTQFIYWAAIRPYHIGMYKAKQIDYKADIIITYGDTTKNGKNSRKQLLSPLKAALIANQRHTVPPDQYLFSTHFKPGNILVESLSTRATELWHQYVHNDLGIHKKMYALKHTAGQSYLDGNENIDSGWLQRQFGHSSLEETETYIRKRKVKKLDESQVRLPSY